MDPRPPAGSAFSGLTAAALHGLSLPPLPVEEALLACAREVGLLDLVVLVDSALHARNVTPEALLAVTGSGRRGAPALRQALRVVDGRSESPYETLLRVLHRTCGIGVEPQHEVRSGGRFVARADLLLLGTRTLHEYDGAHHLTRDQQREDLRRVRALTDAGYDRRGFVKEDLLHHPAVVLRDADHAVGRAHDPARLDGWRRLLLESGFSVAGRHRLARRWAG